MLIGGSAAAREPAPGDDPSAVLAERLGVAVAASLAGASGAAAHTVVVALPVDRTGELAPLARRIRRRLLIQLARLPRARILSAVPTADVGPAVVLTTALDRFERSIVLSGRLVRPGSRDADEVPLLLAAVAQEGAASDAGPWDDGGGAVLRFDVALAGRIAGPVRAVTSRPAEGGDELVVITDDDTRVLALRAAWFLEAAAVRHPEGLALAVPTRDPRGGVVAVPDPAGSTRLWVHPPSAAAGYLWDGTGAATEPLGDGASPVPLGTGPRGGLLVGWPAVGRNQYVRLGVVAGPGPRARFDAVPHPGPVLEAVSGAGWVAFQLDDGTVHASELAPGLPPVPIGSYGSALAVLPLDPGGQPLLVASRAAGQELAVLLLGRAGADEIATIPMPFDVCALASGDYDGEGGRELAAIGCGAPAAVALVRPEGGR